MEEFEYKLSQNDSILELNAVTALIDRIKLVDKSNENERGPCVKFLKEKCLKGSNSVVSTALYGLLSLPGDEFRWNKLLTEFTAAIPHTENLTGIITLIFLVFDNYECDDYKIMFNQHPLITIIKKNPNTWPLIYVKLRERMITIEQLHLPFILYVLYDYDCKMDITFQENLLKVCLVSPYTYEKILLLSKNHLQRTARYCKILTKMYSYSNAYFILSIEKMLKNDIEISLPLIMLKECIYSSEKNKGRCVELLLLARCISIAPLTQLDELLKLCIYYIETQCTSAKITNIVKSVLIAWQIQFPDFDLIITSEISDSMQEIVSSPSEGEEPNMSYNNVLNTVLFTTLEMLCQNIHPSLLQKAPIGFLLPLFNHFLGLVYGENDLSIVTSALDILMRCVAEEPRRSTRLLPVILHRLANCQIPLLNAALIHALPRTAIRDENLSIIVTTLRAISNGPPNMRTLSLRVFYKLVQTDIRCFVYLQDLLAQDNCENFDEYYLAKASVIKDLCKHNIGVDVYRSELAAYISQILNETRALDSDLAQSMALEGLKYLCKNNVIDAGSVWYTLAPRLENESRPLIIKSMCEMLSEFANLSESGPNHDQLVDDVVKRLWDCTKTSNDDVVLAAAYRALGCFNLEQISVGMPECYSEGSNMFGSIPGRSYINLLRKSDWKSKKHIANMLIMLITNEVRNLKRGVYEVSEQHGEPQAMNLPSYSVLGAVSNYVRVNSTCYKGEDVELLQCLRILSQSYSKPLPPMNWNFLQELIHDDGCKKYCIAIASQQAALSGTARRLMDNYIVAVTERDISHHHIIYIYKQLVPLCNSIQPMVIRPFITKTMKMKIIDCSNQNINDPDVKELIVMITALKQVLINKNVSESNKTVVSEVTISFIENSHMDSMVFGLLMDCVHYLPMKLLNKISCPKAIDPMNLNLILRCLKIRCTAAVQCNENPFIYLNNFVDCLAFTNNTIPFSELYKYLRDVFIRHQENPHCKNWLLELMGKIQIQLAEERELLKVSFMCSIFVIAISIISGFYVFRKDSSDLKEFSSCFPYALDNLLRTETYSQHTPQVLEWLYDISTNKTYKVNKECRYFIYIFKLSVLVSRDQDCFNEKLKWMKYIEIDFEPELD